MPEGKWLSINHPDLPRAAGGPASPLKLEVRQDASALHNTLFAVHLSVKYRDPSKPPGYEEQVSVEWRQDESHIDPVRFGAALIGLGEGLVKHGTPA